jgi:NDP-sugar pyrophosphorylase family protein
MSIPIIIQAGGKGSRLRPYTTILPKPLMPIGEVPVLEIVIKQLINFGFRELYISTGHLAHLIMSYFGDGSNWGAKITYLQETQPLGTIGAIKLLAKPRKPFIVMNGDLLTDLDIRALYDFHIAERPILTVAVTKEKVPISLGVIDFNKDHQIVGFREKPRLSFWASMGIYVFSPELWDQIPTDTYYGFDMLIGDMLSKKIHVKDFPWNGIWLDIGRPEDYERAEEELRRFKKRLLP